MEELRISHFDIIYANKRRRLCNHHLTVIQAFGKPRLMLSDEDIMKLSETPEGECPICFLKGKVNEVH